MYLLDSSIIIGLSKTPKIVSEILNSIDDEEAAVSSITVHEVLVGAKSEKQQFILSNLFSAFNILSYSGDCAMLSSKISKDLSKEGKMINQLDILIASIAINKNLTLISLDKDFKKVPGLKCKIFNLKS
jgi:tRNA(fMet)-specific endonuclease VapC